MESLRVRFGRWCGTHRLCPHGPCRSAIAPGHRPAELREARAHLKPGAGLDHLPNALLFYWFQGYISAANIHLLNEYTDYVDAGAVDEATITKLVADFCKGNPDKRPVNAIDKFIQDATKIDVKESDAFDPWEH